MDQKSAMIAVINNPPSTVEDFFRREQAIGEIVGARHILEHYVDASDSLEDKPKEEAGN